eukprot:COSAG02_NODE_24_length_52386_cov_726.042898_20_plen_358_part_00
METYGLSPRGNALQRHEPINVFKVDKVGQIIVDSGPPEKVPQPPSGPIGPDSPRVKFSVRQQAPETARAVMQEAAAQRGHAEAGMTKKEWKRKLLQERHLANQARMAEHLKRTIEAAGNRRELKFQQNLKDLRDNREFVADIFAKVEAADAAKLQKQKKLYDEWESEVFDKIQEQVVDQVDALDIFEMEARKQKLFKEYMAAENRMQEGIKRDVVIKADYDPYQWKKHAVRYKQTTIADPVKRDLEKMYEDKLGPSDSKGTIPKHRTRVCISPQMYDGAKLKGTPHGVFANMMAGNKNLEKSEMNKKIYKDHVRGCFNHFRPLVDHGTLATHELHAYHGTKGRKKVEVFGEDTESEY